MSNLHLQQAIRICRTGGVIAYPTEAVFGLGCLPVYEHAVRRILKLKRRSIDKGLILVAADIEQLQSLVDFSRVKNIAMIKKTWPGPLTWIVPSQSDTPAWLTGSHNTLAVRVSAQPLVRALCQQLGPLVSTSANRSGVAPARSSRRVRAYFQNNIDYIIPAQIQGKTNPTVIRDALTGHVIRPA